MKALDTNILVRFLVADDAKQSKKVYQLFREAEEKRERFYIPLVVLLEVIWVLESAYHISRKDITESIGELFSMPILRFESEPAVRRFLSVSSGSTNDLSDLLIGCVARVAGCEGVVTFDKKAAKLDVFELLR